MRRYCTTSSALVQTDLSTRTPTHKYIKQIYPNLPFESARGTTESNANPGADPAYVIEQPLHLRSQIKRLSRIRQCAFQYRKYLEGIDELPYPNGCQNAAIEKLIELRKMAK